MKKTTLLYIIITIFLISNVNADEQLINMTHAVTIYSTSYTSTNDGQQFLVGSGDINVSEISMSFSRQGSATGDWDFYLYTDNGADAPGSPLATLHKDEVGMASYTTCGFNNLTWDSGQYTVLNASTKYWIVDVGNIGGHGPGTRYFMCANTTSNHYTDGLSRYNNVNSAVIDYGFIIYGEEITNTSTFNINAISIWNSTTIYDFNATINGTTYTTTNGTIVTPYNNTEDYAYEILIQSSDWFSETVTHNLSTDLIQSLKQSQISFKCTDTESQVLTCLNSTIYPNAETYDFYIGARFNTTQLYYNQTQTETISILDNETITITDFYNKNVTIKDDLTGEIQTGLTCVYNGLTQSIDDTYYYYLTTYNISNTTITCEESLKYYPQSNTLTNVIQTLDWEISRYKLALYFSEGTDFTIYSSNETEGNGTDTNIVLWQSNMTLGDIQVVFNRANEGDEGQYFEYFNDQMTRINQTMTVFSGNTTCEWYIKSEDVSRKPISNATIRIDMKTLTNDSGFETVHQRITGTDGITQFPMPSESPETHYRIYITHENFNPIEFDMDVTQYCSMTEDEPKIITMTDSNVYSLNGIIYNIPIRFYNSSRDIPVALFTYDDSVNYYLGTDESTFRKSFSKTGDYLYEATLVSGKQFDEVDRDGSFNLTIYKGNNILTATYVTDFTIYYKPHANKTKLFNEVTTLSNQDNTYMPSLLLILIVFASAGIGYAFKNKEGNSTGKTAFFILTVLVSFIYPTFILAGISIIIHIIYKRLNIGVSE